MNIKLIANNIAWPSLQTRVNVLKEKLEAIYKPIYESITIDIVEGTLEIPVPLNNEELDPSWFQENIINDASGGYDAYILLINRSEDWKAVKGSESDILLGQYIQSGDSLNFYIIADEYQLVEENDLKTYYVFEDTFEHELAHAVYHDLKCNVKASDKDQVFEPGTDNVHFYTYAAKHNWSEMYTNIMYEAAFKFPGITPNLSTISSTIDALITKFSNGPQSVPSQGSAANHLWDTQEDSKTTVRQICASEGLDASDTEIIMACIMQESEFNTQAVNHNRNDLGVIESSDYGICQINDFYHIGEGKDFPSVEYVLQNPDKCVEYMISAFKAGHLNWWVSYSSGEYKKYLGTV